MDQPFSQGPGDTPCLTWNKLILRRQTAVVSRTPCRSLAHVSVLVCTCRRQDRLVILRLFSSRLYAWVLLFSPHTSQGHTV